MGKLVRTFVVAAVISGLAAVSGAAQAADSGTCSLGNKYMVRNVSPYRTFEDAGYTSWQQFRGAEVFVPAQPGLTSEWLQRVVTYEIAAGDCDFGTRDVNVSVLSAGSGFSVRLAGANDKAAGEILRHAQELVK
jgi:hypothetical protein